MEPGSPSVVVPPADAEGHLPCARRLPARAIRLEHEALRALLDEAQPCVLANGGGLVTASETFALLRQHAFTVWLRARPEDQWTRVVAQGDTRPMADNDRTFHNLCAILAEREPLYGQADVVVDTAGRSVDAIAQDLALRFGFVGAA